MTGLPGQVRSRRRPRFPIFALALAAPLLLAAEASAQDTFVVSPDITVVLGSDTVHDEEAVEDDQIGPVLFESLGTLPAGADVTAVHREPSGDVLFALDTTANLGGTTFEPRDVIRWDGATHTMEFDGSSEGVPAGAQIDAITRDGPIDLLLSFDVTVDLGGTTIADEDLARFDGMAFTVELDGSAEGISVALDLDAASQKPSGELVVSFDGSGSVGGVSFDDEDALTFDPTSSTWALSYDGDALDMDWGPGDLDAVHFVPEPGVLLQLLAGSGLLTVFAARRSRRPDR